MTKRKQDLKSLRDEVAAGTWPGSDVYSHMSDRCASFAYDSFNGSLDAAMALHKALLPDHRARIDVGRRFRAWVITPSNKKNDAYSESPARAWLLCILDAIIAREGQSDGL